MMDVETARARSRILSEIRRFFAETGYLEVETPILSPALIPERSIEVFATTLRSPHSPPRALYLIPSPEVWMKRLIAHGWPSMYQLTKSFRNGESLGRLHNPEFTMLEYYTVGGSYEDSFSLTDALLSRLSRMGLGAALPPITRMTVAEAFNRYTGIDLETSLAAGDLRNEVERRGMRPGPDEGVEELFNRLLVQFVEPALEEFGAVALFDYPSHIPTTARRKLGTPWAERWELYLGGVEVANCYSEETEPAAVDAYFASESTQKEASLEPHPPDEEYRRIFADGFPDCSGCAMGVDRLVQALIGATSIEGVILFPLSSIFR